MDWKTYMSFHNLNEYRKAKVIVKDLTKALSILKATRAGLENYRNYRPIRNILTTINNEIGFVRIALEEYTIILETKGERRK